MLIELDGEGSDRNASKLILLLAATAEALFSSKGTCYLLNIIGMAIFLEFYEILDTTCYVKTIFNWFLLQIFILASVLEIMH